MAKLHTLTCSQCGEPIAYSLLSYSASSISTSHCYLCMLSFLELAELLNSTHMEEKTNFPTKIELYANTGNDDITKRTQQYRSNCIKLLKKVNI